VFLPLPSFHCCRLASLDDFNVVNEIYVRGLYSSEVGKAVKGGEEAVKVLKTFKIGVI